MAAETSTRTLSVFCPSCLDPESVVRLDLTDLPKCRCENCDEEFTPSEAAAKFSGLAERWQAVADWVAAAPVV